MKKILTILLFFVVYSTAFSQKTNFSYDWAYNRDGSSCVRLLSLEIENNGNVIVSIEIKALKALKRLKIANTYNTVIKAGNIKLLRLAAIILEPYSREYNVLDANLVGWDNVGKVQTRIYKLIFSVEMPSGIETVSMVDAGDFDGWKGVCFHDMKIINPRRNYVNISTEYSAKQNIDSNRDGLCGIYEPLDGEGANLACIKYDGDYKLIYLSSPSSYAWREIWRVGDIYANLRQTASGIMKADWYNAGKELCTSAYVAFDGVSLKAVVDGKETIYLKTYPVSSSGVVGGNTSSSMSEWTGSGFALNNGYIVTNHHVVKGASSIKVLGVNGNASLEYNATVVAVDKNNDLALIKIQDNRFKGFGVVPYAVKNRICEVGEEVFVLGYPLTTHMGEEIKLTSRPLKTR